MSAYDGDRRVGWVNRHHATVNTTDGRYHVTAETGRHDWWASDMAGGAVSRATSLDTRGPYRSAGEAIHALIGDPR